MEQTIQRQTIMNSNLKMIACSSCGSPMPELRLTKYGYSYCVKCSEAGLGEGRKQGVPVLMGEGDHTWTETVIMTDSQYKDYLRNEKALKNLDKTGKAEMLDMDKEERNLYGPVTIKDTDGKQEEIS
tara:strand:- start:382 stop:762 length:381 start_codon:yes stop_codon:yes gene_type:complete